MLQMDIKIVQAIVECYKHDGNTLKNVRATETMNQALWLSAQRPQIFEPVSKTSVEVK